MPSKNSVNRPKNKNTARAKAQHKAAVARRTPQSAILFGKVDSKKVAQKKLRRARLSAAHASTLDAARDADVIAEGDGEGEGDVEMIEDEDEIGVPTTTTKGGAEKLDPRVKKEARKAKIAAEAEDLERSKAGVVTEKEFKMDTTRGTGTTIGGPPPASSSSMRAKR